MPKRRPQMNAIFTAAKDLGFVVDGSTLTMRGVNVYLSTREDGWVEIDCWKHFTIECNSEEQAISFLPGTVRTIQNMTEGLALSLGKC